MSTGRNEHSRAIIAPEDYLTEVEVLAKWPMLIPAELRKARKMHGIRFYAFRGGPCYTPAQVQDYIDRTYLRGGSGIQKPVEFPPPQHVPAATVAPPMMMPAGMTPELAAAAVEHLKQIGKRQKPKR
jgi:hypothetical protein